MSRVTEDRAAILQAQELAGRLLVGPGRCPICNWPLAESKLKGCVIGNCAYRPERGAELERVRDARAKFDSFVAAIVQTLAASRLSTRRELLARLLERVSHWDKRSRDIDNSGGDSSLTSAVADELRSLAASLEKPE